MGRKYDNARDVMIGFVKDGSDRDERGDLKPAKAVRDLNPGAFTGMSPNAFRNNLAIIRAEHGPKPGMFDIYIYRCFRI